MADKQDNISNYMGWLIRCIEEDYMQVETVSGSVEKAKIAQEIKATVEENKKNRKNKTNMKYRNIKKKN